MQSISYPYYWFCSTLINSLHTNILVCILHFIVLQNQSLYTNFEKCRKSSVMHFTIILLYYNIINKYNNIITILHYNIIVY